MRKALLALVFCGITASLFAADAFVGTWKLDMAKSKPAPSTTGKVAKEAILVIGEKGADRESYHKTTYTDGSSDLIRWTVPSQGGIVKYQQGAAAKGSIDFVTRISGGEDYWTGMLDGKQVSMGHWTVSKDGKEIRGVGKGIDAQGKPYDELWIGYRQ
jgi:hypothetical protein